MKLGPLLTHLQELETGLGDDYRRLGERHAADHDVYHQCHAFARQCQRHADALAPHAERYAEEIDHGEGPAVWATLLERLRREGSEVLGRSPQSGLHLLRDLRELFLAAEETSITWVMTGQAAQAARDAALLETVTRCHTETELQVKWLTTRIKVAAPQALVTA
jgi:hypothetical protein